MQSYHSRDLSRKMSVRMLQLVTAFVLKCRLRLLSQAFLPFHRSQMHAANFWRKPVSRRDIPSRTFCPQSHSLPFFGQGFAIQTSEFAGQPIRDVFEIDIPRPCTNFEKNRDNFCSASLEVRWHQMANLERLQLSHRTSLRHQF
jgi:hypothetical protein